MSNPPKETPRPKILPLPKNETECIATLNWALQTYKRWVPPTNFDEPFIRVAKCISASLETPTACAKATYHFTIPDNYLNLAGSVHGGSIATFFDVLTSPVLMLCTTHRWENAGLTRCLNVTYFQPVKKGEVVIMETFATSVGKRSATVRGELRRESDGVLVAMCSHEKVLADHKVYYKL